jgi:LysM repeat protein
VLLEKDGVPENETFFSFFCCFLSLNLELKCDLTTINKLEERKMKSGKIMTKTSTEFPSEILHKNGLRKKKHNDLNPKS